MNNTIFSIPLLRTLYERLGIPMENIHVQSSTQNLDSWEESLIQVLKQQGFRGIQWHTSLENIASQVDLNLPVLGVTPTGEWLLLEQASWKWVYYYNLSRNFGAWISIKQLNKKLQHQEISWVLIEAVQPKSILSSTQPNNILTPFQRLFRLGRFEKLDILLVGLLASLIGILSLTIPLSVQLLLNWIAFASLLQPILLLGVLVAFILLLSSGLSIFQRVIVERLERRLFIRIVEDLQHRFYQVRLSTLDHIHVPDLANRFFDILTVQKAAGSILIDGLGALLQIMVATLVLAFYHPYFMVLDAILIIGMIIIFKTFVRMGTHTAIVESKSKYKVATWIETIGNHSNSFRMGNTAIADLESERRTATWLQKRGAHFRIFLWQYSSARLFQVIISVFVLILGGQLVLQGELTIGQFVAAEFVITNALLGFTKFVDKMDTIYDLLASVDKIGHVLDLEMEEIAGIDHNMTTDCSISLESVQFQSNNPCISGTLESGKIHWITCPFDHSLENIAETILGLRPPITGTVRHAEVPVSLFSLADRYKHSSIIGLNSLFQGSIYSNITMDNPNISEKDIWNTLAELQLDDWILQLGGLNAPIHKDIPLLTKGILMARFLLHKAPLTIFVDFFQNIPQQWQEQWLHLLEDSSRTTIILELQSRQSTSKHFNTGDLYDYFST